MLDRRKVYRTLMDNSIPVPNLIIVSRDDLPEGQVSGRACVRVCGCVGECVGVESIGELGCRCRYVHTRKRERTDAGGSIPYGARCVVSTTPSLCMWARGVRMQPVLSPVGAASRRATHVGRTAWEPLCQCWVLRVKKGLAGAALRQTHSHLCAVPYRHAHTCAQTDPEGFVEDHDYVELNGSRIYKPFVEKPASGEDHNVYIYYPYSMVSPFFFQVAGNGGCATLPSVIQPTAPAPDPQLDNAVA